MDSGHIDGVSRYIDGEEGGQENDGGMDKKMGDGPMDGRVSG